MKYARFAVGSAIHHGIVREDGIMQTNSGGEYAAWDVIWMPPVLPSKAIGLALNYADHAKELQMKSPEDPALFFKPTSSFIGHGAQVIYPTDVEYMHYEVELVVVIGQRCHRVKAEQADQYIRGYTIGNDVSPFGTLSRTSTALLSGQKDMTHLDHWVLTSLSRTKSAILEISIFVLL